MDLLEQIRSNEFGRKLQRTMADGLHRSYDHVADEEIPRRLQELLRRLDTKQSRSERQGVAG